jgi:NAD(P)H-dependent FMN reductase
MLNVAIIIGSTRPGRKGDAVAAWVQRLAAPRADARFEVVDLAEYQLPHLDEPYPPAMGQYSRAHTKAWAAKIDAFDAFVFVTPEYNHATSGVLKNAIDFLFKEWKDKVAGYVSYGAAGGVRAVEQLRLVMGELSVASVRTQVALSLFTDFEQFTHFKPAANHEATVRTMLDEVVAWGGALKTLRPSK